MSEKENPNERSEDQKINVNDWRLIRAQMRETGELPDAPPREPEEKITIANKGFSYWFFNYFWFNYRGAILGGFAILLVIAATVYDAMSKKTPDMEYVVATVNYIDEENMTAFDKLAEQVTGDANSDGAVIIQSQMLLMDDTSELGAANFQRFPLMLYDENILLFFLDDEIAGYIAEESDIFWNLAEMGVSAETDRPWLMRVDTLPLFEYISAPGTSAPVYVAIQRSDISENAKPEVIERYNRTVDLVSAVARGEMPAKLTDAAS